jgi:hypothetical protein
MFLCHIHASDLTSNLAEAARRIMGCIMLKTKTDYAVLPKLVFRLHSSSVVRFRITAAARRYLACIYVSSGKLREKIGAVTKSRIPRHVCMWK